MRRLEFLTGNWGLKILALVLAVILYHAVKQGSAEGGAAAAHERNEIKEP